MKDAATYAIPDFVDIILAGGERADEAMYYLLHERLNKQLKGKFVVYQHQLMDEFEDVVEDFFLYLREGKDGRSRTPYQSLQRIPINLRGKNSLKIHCHATNSLE